MNVSFSDLQFTVISDNYSFFYYSYDHSSKYLKCPVTRRPSFFSSIHPKFIIRTWGLIVDCKF